MAAKLREAKEIKNGLQSEKGTEVGSDQEHHMDIDPPAARAGGSSEVLTEQHAHALKVQSTDYLQALMIHKQTKNWEVGPT